MTNSHADFLPGNKITPQILCELVFNELPLTSTAEKYQERMIIADRTHYAFFYNNSCRLTSKEQGHKELDDTTTVFIEDPNFVHKIITWINNYAH